MTKRVLLTGVTGYVGGLVGRWLDGRYDWTGVSARCAAGPRRIPCDLTDPAALAALARQVKPDVIIHAAGVKNIGLCERDPALADAVNRQSTSNLLTAFPDARVIYISTDYVFDGVRGRYQETDPPEPTTVYGRSKRAAEREGLSRSDCFFVLRLAALYDREATFLQFLDTSLSKEEPVDCYHDAYYSPTFYADFLHILGALIDGESFQRRVYHVCGERLSRFAFASAYAQVFGHPADLIRPVSLQGAGGFLFPDLSLCDQRTREEFGLERTSVRRSLEAIWKEKGEE
ncbi:sugar nucleotide-binding protein [Heliobacterium gestii]|uniref:Sugar nucleotide-binding protein n=1 Tax=Heliomicrobium gestii TaxID=2699 RepID=A0A845LBR4_HELGE|nr:SDR family oxidoreductase [Heliomicrobium gestii]MBM7866709.1 dTDP-4-dehydrorhamnose reductase [Heliomicrobium gestii]MZP43011.1 sugar nucleotide-binding protein [Heliomicrobium gestii]